MKKVRRYSICSKRNLKGQYCAQLMKTCPFKKCNFSVAVSAVLNQGGIPVAFMSSTLQGIKVNYNIVEKEAIAIAETVTYLLCGTFILSPTNVLYPSCSTTGSTHQDYESQNPWGADGTRPGLSIHPLPVQSGMWNRRVASIDSKWFACDTDGDRTCASLAPWPLACLLARSFL